MNLKIKSYPTRKFMIVKMLIMLFAVSSFGQQTRNTFWENVNFGGGIGLGFGDGYFSGTITPSAIYEFNPYIGLGLGLNATYATQKNLHKSTILGGSILAIANPYEFVQLSIEFEELNIQRNFEDGYFIDNDNYWYPALFLGIGYRSYNMTVGIRYDVLYDDNKSIYTDPWMPFVRFYF